MPVLKVHASMCEIERMVQAEEIRSAFVKRLKESLARAGIAEWGAGVRLAKTAGTTPKAASKWLNGESMPGRSNMAAIASDLGVRVEWLQFGTGEASFAPVRAEGGDHDGPSENGSPSKRDYALIPQYTAKASAGNGYHNDHVELTEGLVFKRDWLDRMALKEDRLCVIYAEGYSMDPTISDGDVLLIDRASTEPRNGKVYAIQRPDGSVSVKRLVQSFSGGWVIRSDNPDKTLYPDEPISANDLQQIEIIGRSVWGGGGM